MSHLATAVAVSVDYSVGTDGRSNHLGAQILRSLRGDNVRQALIKGKAVAILVSTMSFLDWPVEQESLSKRAQRRRKAIAVRLIELFAQTFSEVEYDLFWESSMINSQAWRLGNRRRVTVYGGLVRHPAITASGIALMLAHETGHHLGGPPLDPDLRWPTWQGQADYWAASQGMPRVLGPDAAKLTRRGAKQIAALHEEFSAIDSEPDISAEMRTAIFRAGALGEDITGLLQEAFQQMLDERDR